MNHQGTTNSRPDSKLRRILGIAIAMTLILAGGAMAGTMTAAEEGGEDGDGMSSCIHIRHEFPFLQVHTPYCPGPIVIEDGEPADLET